MTEAFVRKIKRDYVRVGLCPAAQTVMHQAVRWITHHNEVHPHKALRYRSPRESSQLTKVKSESCWIFWFGPRLRATYQRLTSREGRSIVGIIILTVVAAVMVLVQVLILSPVPSVAAISADLARKCREMAIKAHPPKPAGTKAYAQAERDFFRECISKNGEMQENGSEKGPSTGPR